MEGVQSERLRLGKRGMLQEGGGLWGLGAVLPCSCSMCSAARRKLGKHLLAQASLGTSARNHSNKHNLHPAVGDPYPPAGPARGPDGGMEETSLSECLLGVGLLDSNRTCHAARCRANR